MDKINAILSIQNLSRLSDQDPLQQLQMLQELQRQQQQQQLQLQEHHQNNLPNPFSDLMIEEVNGHEAGTHQSNGQSSQSNSFSDATDSHNGMIDEQQVMTSQKEIIDLITCVLCQGYIIDAATLDLCMHTFCRPCAVKYIRDHLRCPECHLEIKDKRFLNRLKPDSTMQSVVYKLVPGLYEKEMARRREFYAARPTAVPRYKSEMFGDIPLSKTLKGEDMINISMTWIRDEPDDDPITTYFTCRADTQLRLLKKILVAKFGLERPIKFYFGNLEIHFDLSSLMDVAATYNWSPESKVLGLSFKEHEDSLDTLNDQRNKMTMG